MKELEEKILRDGEVLPGNVLKVGKFLNQQVDTVLLGHMADEVKRLFSGKKVDKVLTIEASGIAFAALVAYKYGVPMVFAKKHKSANMSSDTYTARVFSFTHGVVNQIAVGKEHINKGENILICDDFLANGNALKGLISITEEAGAKVAGIAIEIEKAFQNGGDELRQKGYDVQSLARIKSMENCKIVFED